MARMNIGRDVDLTCHTTSCSHAATADPEDGRRVEGHCARGAVVTVHKPDRQDHQPQRVQESQNTVSDGTYGASTVERGGEAVVVTCSGFSTWRCGGGDPKWTEF
jgi:hypothetical protein